MDLDQVKTELGAYLRKENKKVKALVYGGGVQLNSFCRKISKVNDEWPSPYSLIGHVVKGFTGNWSSLGSATFKAKILKARKQAVNFAIKPHEVEGSWLAEMDEEDKDLKDKTISVHIMKELLEPKVVKDVNILSGKGDYDDTKLDIFGHSMDGLQVIIANQLNDPDHPMWKIPFAATPTQANIIDIVTEFEQKLPEEMKDMVDKIYMSPSLVELYTLAYRDEFGMNTDYNGTKSKRSPLGEREIVAMQALRGSNIIFATVKDNLVQLIDVIDSPKFTDIQKFEYTLKLFMKFTLGYDFAVNQLVFVSDYVGTTWGLGDDDMNELLYPETNVPVASGSSSPSPS